MLSKSSKVLNHNELLPTKLRKCTQFFGMPVEQHKNFTEKKIKRHDNFKNISLRERLMLFFSNIPVLLRILQGSLELYNPVYFIMNLFDHCVYLIAYYIIFRRRHKIVHCIEQLKNVSDNNFQSSNPSKHELTSILIMISLLFSSTFFLWGVTYYSKLQIKDVPETTFQICFQILKLINWTLYCLFICVGISTQITLFAYVSNLIYENLCLISTVLNKSVKSSKYAITVLIQQRKMFCNIQRATSIFDSIFQEIIFIWILKVTVRCCVAAYEILTIPWTDINMLGLSIFVFNTIYDISHLIIIAFYGGRIIDGKDIVLQSLIYLSRRSVQNLDDTEKELHFFVTLLGQSHIGVTASDIFHLTRRTAVTVMASIFSYYVLIYQLTAK